MHVVPTLFFSTEDEKQSAVKKLNALPYGDSMLHFDYHPDNIMSDGKMAAIID